VSALGNLEVFLRLNRECENQLWPATAEQLSAFLRMAYHAAVAQDGVGMLIAFDHEAPYNNSNFAWFKERYVRFVYIDRVAVAASARGRGVARSLYEALIAKARSDNHTILCTEFYSDPPNPQSEAFHSAMGFMTVGHAFLPERGKSIRRVARKI
jgi:uncharacterized protein